MQSRDVLIIGSGIAGLSVAIKLAQRFPDRRIAIITKQDSAESNTRYAQGGIAVVSDLNNDSFEAHIGDTLRAGDGLCDPLVVDHVVRQAPARLRELIELGADFDRDPSGELILGREGGHKANRIIHAKDVTGLSISTALLRKVRSLRNVSLFPHHLAIDLVIGEEMSQGKTNSTCHGALVLDERSGAVEMFLAKATVVATGGLGQLYPTTTNPLIATGDGIAMALRAGASVSNMEFIQFHPTALYDPEASPAFLISEAVRGEGAYLRNDSGERFMYRYHVDAELACRDIVARAIASEIRDGDQPFVYLDCTHIPHETLGKHFPNILQTCLSRGIDIRTDYIPVAPAAHYLCGGIDVDLDSHTSVHRLYACGECSNTGLHGANRLASNSLLEATVFAHNCFEHISLFIDDASSTLCVPSDQANTPVADDIAALAQSRVRLQGIMSRHAGIVRGNKGLRVALEEIKKLETVCAVDAQGIHRAEWYELRNLLACAKLVVQQSLMRAENKGGFYNEDLQYTRMLTSDQGAGAFSGRS